MGAVGACGVRPDASGGKKKGRRGSAELGDATDAGGCGQETAGAGPAGGQPQQEAAAVVDDPSGNPEQPPADGVACGEPLLGLPA